MVHPRAPEPPESGREDAPTKADFVNMQPVERVSRVVQALYEGRDLGCLAEIYQSPGFLLMLTGKELIREFANDLEYLCRSAQQSNVIMRQFAEWRAFQPMTPLVAVGDANLSSTTGDSQVPRLNQNPPVADQ